VALVRHCVGVWRSWVENPSHLLDVVVAESAAVLQLLAGENQALLVRGNALLVLDLALDIVDGVRGLDLKGDGLARKGFYEAECLVNSTPLVVCLDGLHLHCGEECRVSQISWLRSN